MLRMEFDRSRFAVVKTRQFMTFFLLPFIVFLSLLFGAPAGRANDVYIAQFSAGAGNGADCVDARPVDFFNNSGNWGSGSAQIGPGSTVHLCGTITTQMTAQGGGTSGNPITILWETGAQIALPSCDINNGCFSNNGFGSLVLDGGTNGAIQNTDSGSALGHQNESMLVYMHNCFHCEIKNLNLGPVYLHTSVSDTTNQRYICILTTNSADPVVYHVHNNGCHDANQGFDYVAANGDTGAEFDHNTFYNTNGSINPANTGSSHLTKMLIHDNKFGSHANWATTGCSFHADDIHAYGQNGGIGESIYVYNNLFTGNLGNCPTSQLFFEDSINNSFIFNNLFLPTNYGNINNGIVNVNGLNNAFYNNTIVGQLISGDVCLQVGGRGLSGSINVVNNIISSCNTLTVVNAAMALTGWDYNTYGGKAGGLAFHWINISNTILATWATNCACDLHSEFGAATSYVGVDSAGRLQSGSPAIRWAANLASLGISTLDSDYAGVVRPGPGTCSVQGKSSACWDAGAYALAGSSVQRPAAPTGLVGTVQTP